MALFDVPLWPYSPSRPYLSFLSLFISNSNRNGGDENLAKSSTSFWFCIKQMRWRLVVEDNLATASLGQASSALRFSYIRTSLGGSRFGGGSGLMSTARVMIAAG